MNGYDLLASIVASFTSLAWPIAIVACVYMFRQRLNEILHRLQLKHKDTEISFQIEAAKDEADRLPPATSADAEPPSEHGNLSETGVSPESLILRRWNELESAVRKAYASHEELNSAPRRRSTWSLMKDLESSWALNRAVLRTFEELRSIRNKLVHGGFDDVPTMQHAVDYSSLVDRVIASLEEMPSLDEMYAAAGVDRQKV